MAKKKRLANGNLFTLILGILFIIAGFILNRFATDPIFRLEIAGGLIIIGFVAFIAALSLIFTGKKLRLK